MKTFSIITICCYLVSIGFVIPYLAKENAAYKKVALIFAGIALVGHLIILQDKLFHLAPTETLSLLAIASAVCFIINIAMTIVAVKDRGWLLVPVVYSLSIVTIAMANFMPLPIIMHLEATPSLLFHIVLALIGYATLVISTLYALQVAFVNHQLKSKVIMHSDMPPLMTLERKFFHITQVGYFLLTLTLITGAIYIDNIFDRHNIHKVIFSLIAWGVYSTLLWGHYLKGWRGTRVVWLSVIATAILTLAYFGSRLIQSLIYF